MFEGISYFLLQQSGECVFNSILTTSGGAMCYNWAASNVPFVDVG